MTTESQVVRGLTIMAMVLAGLFGLLAVMFTAGETFADPGGWEAVGLIALWLVPLIVLLGLALARPSVAQPVLEALSAVWVVAALWSIAAPHTWRSFESTNGPVRAVACLALLMPIAALGWHRALPAGAMLLVIGLAAVVATGSAPLRVVAVPAIVIGALLLTAGLVERGHHQDKAAGPAATRPA
ncbi:MAG TPA: hypothetical protein VHO00_11780 [Actinomycetes bacterium]|nr:hypothetical protein [Actinomycetes bacterium]